MPDNDTLEFSILDVFTDRPFAGNQLGVVYDASDLDADQMQDLAREFGYSESIFFLPPSEALANYRIRIFTPAEELPFAGHPSIGAAVEYVRRNKDRLTADPEGTYTVMQETKAGVMTIVVDGDHAWLTSKAIDLGDDMDAGPLLGAAGLSESDQAGAARTASAGLEHYMLPVKADAVGRAAAKSGFAPKVYLFNHDLAAGTAHVRLFGSGLGVPEDPATGSAALCLGVYLFSVGAFKGDGVHELTVSQGAEMGRPSTLDLKTTVEGGELKSVSVGGSAVTVASGAMRVP
ncbi:PhzF family phenazine biosynthesis protein [Salininema proteolyticum]|uniref:PhzF family phenazine biosynthesis protein n=1 Tax=Salininema proteolyticum TaxID=1607685 RepID=A0ABV8TZM2_9ACTN